jgi:hypothetical protein
LLLINSNPNQQEEKMSKLTTFLTLCGLIAVLLTACSEQDAPVVLANKPDVQAIQQTPQSKTREPDGRIGHVSGTLIRLENGLRLFTDRYLYKVIGTDLSSFVGKNLKIVGTIEERDDMPIITISSIHLIY